MSAMLYLVRHADAIDLEDDAARTLSRRGREQVHALAKFLGRSDAFQPEEIWYSTLVRAKETAERLADELKLKRPLVETPNLEPGADPRALLKALQAHDGALAVVGHNPYLERLATLLVTGAARPESWVMKKCSVVALERDGARWLVRWHVSPELLP